MPALGLLILSLLTASPPDDRTTLVVVVGAPGTPEYAADFRSWSNAWQAAAVKGNAEAIAIGLDAAAGTSDRDRLEKVLRAQSTSGTAPLWIVLIGHGTFDGHEAKFNLRGPDVTDLELSAWLDASKRPLVVIDCTSASAPFLNRLSRTGRIVITATRSGSEVNFTRFGRFIAESIGDLQADLDKDGQVSLLEAYLAAGHGVAEYYRTRSQLASEHALLDDNGDRQGTPSDWFRGTRATRKARDGAAPDGLRAHQLHLVPSDGERRIPAEIRKRRDELELAVAALRDRKSAIAEDEYYRRLEPLMIELGRLYRQAESPGSSPP